MNSQNLVNESFALANVIRISAPRPLDDDQVRAKVAAIKNWWDTHPNYIMDGETVGRFVRSEATSYYYVDNGVAKYKIDQRAMEPVQSHMVTINAGNGDFFVYFPETDGFVEAKFVMGYEFALASLQGIDPGALSYENVLFDSTTSRTCVEVENGFELHLVFDSVKVGMNPPGEIEMVIHGNDAGQITQIDQNRLGITQTTTLTYREFADAAGVLSEINADPILQNCPDPSVRTAQGTYDEEAQKSILFFRFQNSNNGNG